MRLSDLLGRPVFDNTGERVGFVQDVRTEQDGMVLGSWGAALTVKGLLVTDRKWASELGYKAAHAGDLWPIKAITNGLHRRSKFVPWELVEIRNDKTIWVDTSMSALSKLK